MTSPKPAAAVILVRETPDLEVFWMRRAAELVFQGGFYAFPGGQLDSDEDPRTGAARELFEETGVRADPAQFVEVGRWVTPAFAPRRFDTFFFLAHCARGEQPHVASGEHDLGEWVRPGDAVERWMEGRILVAPPVMHALRCLAQGLPGVESRMKAVPWARGEQSQEIEMRPGIVLVPLRTPTLPPATHTNCYVLGGDEVIVVDPASPYEEEQTRLDHILARRRIREIWLTHLHRDHVSGANHLKHQRRVRIAAHAVTARDLAGIVEVDRTFEDDERVELPGKPGWVLRILHTPGHARGHVCIFEERNGSLITGDLMAGAGTIVIDPPEGHMATYLDSLKKMQALPVTALFPAHGPVMANAKTKIQQYIDHRLMRESRMFRPRCTVWQSGRSSLTSKSSLKKGSFPLRLPAARAWTRDRQRHEKRLRRDAFSESSARSHAGRQCPGHG
jgi:glyoxylase-like metal-dependent hydrolase (beta-lactamase superfamily II)/8-oxo-dGTP pyrophosphatase MutT (NUDIX family)